MFLEDSITKAQNSYVPSNLKDSWCNVLVPKVTFIHSTFNKGSHEASA